MENEEKENRKIVILFLVISLMCVSTACNNKSGYEHDLRKVSKAIDLLDVNDYEDVDLKALKSAIKSMKTSEGKDIKKHMEKGIKLIKKYKKTKDSEKKFEVYDQLYEWEEDLTLYYYLLIDAAKNKGVDL